MIKRYFDIIERWVRKRLYFKFAIAIISIGLSFIVIPDLWEFIYEFLISIILVALTELDISWDPPPPPSSDSTIQTILGILLVISGFVIFFYFERKLKIEEKQSDFLKLKIVEIDAIVIEEASKNTKYPKFSITIKGEFLTGHRDIIIDNLEFVRYLDGCLCYTKSMKLKFDDSVYSSFYKLPKPLSLNRRSTITFTLKRDFEPPLENWNPERLKVGDIMFKYSYRFSEEEKIVEKSLIFHQDGFTTSSISEISKPPRLNDDKINYALANSIITKNDSEFCRRFSESDRYLILGGKDFTDDANEVFQEDIVRLKEINNRIESR